MTFSIAARCPDSGMLGVAVASSSIAVAARCSHVRSGVGAVLSQNVTNPALGPLALDLMASGLCGQPLLQALAAQEAHMDWRQLVLVPLRGDIIIHSGAQAMGIHAAAQGQHCAAGGNLLAREDIPARMVAAFENSHGHLADRLLAAMQAAVDAGGEAGPIHAAGLKITDRPSWPVIDLRVDWSDGAPISELAAVWQRYRPQLQDYVTRALNPEQAPGFGVPGAP